MSYGVFSGLGDTYSFATIQDLAAFDDTGTIDGTIAYVQTVRSYWSKHVEAPPPASNGITVVPTASGSGGWYRMDVPSLTWQAQATWYVDPVNGDDQNDGSSSAAGGPAAVPPYVGAIKTWAEFTRRIQNISVNTTVNLLGTMTEDIVGVFRGTSASLELLVKGTPTAAASGTVTVASNPVPLTNTRGILTVAGIASFVGYEGKIVETVGVKTLWSVVLLNSAGSAATPYWAEAGAAATPSVGSLPAANDAARVLNLTSVPTIQLEAQNLTIRARYLKFSNSTTNKRGAFLSVDPQFFAFFEACDIGIVSIARNTYFVGCSIGTSGSVTLAGPGSAQFYGGGGTRSFSCSNGGITAFQGTALQGAQLTASGNGTALNALNPSAPLGVFDSPANTSGVLVTEIARALVVAIYGSGNAQAGLAVRRGATVDVVAGSVPTITGAGGDIEINGTVAPNLPTALVAGAVVPAAQAVTWANWNNAAIFNRTLLAYSNGTRLIG